MSGTGSADHASKRHGPEPAAASPTTVGSTSTTEASLVSHLGKYVTFTITGNDIHIVFGATGVEAATTDDEIWFQNSRERVFVDDAHAYWRAIRASSASDATVRITIEGGG